MVLRFCGLAIQIDTKVFGIYKQREIYTLNNMKKKSLLLIISSVLLSCTTQVTSEFGAVQEKEPFVETAPYGMVLVRAGSYMMGLNSQTNILSQPDNSKMVTVDAFWMDDTEITNDEYRTFINWVTDSIAYTLLIRAGLTDYALIDDYDDEEEEVDAFEGNYAINWAAGVPWDDDDEEIQGALAPMFYSDGTLRAVNLYYSYSWLNYDQAQLPRNKFDVTRGTYPEGALARVDTAWIDNQGKIQEMTIERVLREPRDLMTNKIVAVYPDTMVWIRTFQASFNEPMLRTYFYHVAFSDYPVVGVTWEQAHAFCHWRTKYYKEFTGNGAIQDYRLPTEAEWEYAARGGKRMAMYPWGNNYARDKDGCFLANFKPYRGSYADDIGTTTMKVGQYRPNDYGLYDMAGNVAEWTSSTYSNSSNAIVFDLNPNFSYMARQNDPPALKRKVIRGGSWKDISFYLQCGARTYEYQYESKPYIGFRCVRSHIAG